MPLTPDRYVIVYVEPGTDRWFRLERTPVGSFIDGGPSLESPAGVGELLEKVGHHQVLESKGLAL